MGVFDLRKYRFLIMIIVIGLIFLALISLFNFALEKMYPMDYESIILKYSQEYNLDVILVASVIRAESKFDPYAISHKEARGLMQIASITGNWASEELSIENYNKKLLFDPDINIRIGCWYLSKLKREFNNDMTNVLAAYNAGSGNVRKWLNNKEYSPDGKQLRVIPFGETKRYVERVNRNYKIYSYIYGR